MNTIDWHPTQPPRRRRGRLILLILLAAIVLGGGTALWYYVDALWFNGPGSAACSGRRLNLQGTVFIVFFALTLAILYGTLRALKPEKLAELTGGTIIINGQPVRLPVGPVLKTLTELARPCSCRLSPGSG